MRFRILGFAAIVFTGLAHLTSDADRLSHAAQNDAKSTATYGKDVVPFLKKHCFSCHADGKKKGGMSFDKFKSDEDVQKDRATWEAVRDAIDTKHMPPKSQPQPSAEEAKSAMRAIEGVLANFDCTKARNVGRVTIRRLNRNEYNNTIRDLVGVDFKPAADFPADDVGYGFDNIGDVLTMSPLLVEKYLNAAEAILDKAIVVVDPPKVTKERLAGLRASKSAGEVPKGGSPLLFGKGEVSASTTVETGDYFVRAEVYATSVGDEPVKGVLRVNGADVKTFDVKITSNKGAATVEGKLLRLKAGSTRLSVAFLNPFTDPKDAAKRRQLHVKSISIEGPHNPPPVKRPDVHTKLMAYDDDLTEREGARVILTRFATRAYRRPVGFREVDRLLGLYDRAKKDGDRFENSVKLAMMRVLVSPNFLFRVEQDPVGAEAGKAYPVNDYALANRLSYFLWSSMPDDELFQLASKGQLRDHLEPQVKRMLKDARSYAFVEHFGGQWLTLRSLAQITPDPKAFPDFDDSLRNAMLKETELFFDAILREDRSILDFIDADFSYLNERLAKHYGIDGVKGANFRRVQMPASRGGILTQASILTLTSYPARTSPVQRGKWVLEQVLGTPPPEPPPDIPALEDNKKLEGSLRQRMEQHRANPSCAICHQRMDPIGFAFENYDAIGRWRDKDEGFKIDPAGVLPDGKTFKGPKELKTILRGKKDLFARSLSEKVLTYALGRGLEYYDRCAVDKIVAALDKNDYRFSTLLLEVVKSEPFLMRTASPHVNADNTKKQ
jgi:mono/diheme cytochrome c family protein